MLPLLAGCGASSQPLTRTELVEWPVLVYAQLPAALTDPVAAPPAPPLTCKLPDGTPTPCVFDGLMREQAWQELLQRINEDRASSARLSGQSVAPVNGLTAGDGGR